MRVLVFRFFEQRQKTIDQKEVSLEYPKNSNTSRNFRRRALDETLRKLSFRLPYISGSNALVGILVGRSYHDHPIHDSQSRHYSVV